MNKDKVIRYLMTLALVLIAASVSAQHVKFKGIPLGLEVQEFKQKMLEKGFALNDRKTANYSDNSSVCSFTGKFAGDFVDVNCSLTKDTKKVSKLSVEFKRWTVALERNAGVTREQQNDRFNVLANAISQNYGPPAKNSKSPQRNLERLAIWNVEGGTINLVLHNIEGRYITMSLVFFDKLTMEE